MKAIFFIWLSARMVRSFNSDEALPEMAPPGALELGAMTVIPVFGILSLGWSSLQILLIYWCEAVVLGGFTVLRMALARPVYRTQADFIEAHPWILQHYPISDEEWRAALAAPSASYPSYKQFFVPLFIGHYSFFLLVLAILLGTLVKQVPLKEWYTFFTTEWSPQLLLAISAMIISHGWRFWTDDLQGRRYTRTLPIVAMLYPYRQLIILHMALVLGGIALVFFALPPALAILLILLKAGFDMNWIRMPFGPKKIDWTKMAESDRKEDAGKIVGKTIEERPDSSNATFERSGTEIHIRLPAQGVGRMWRKMRAGGCLIASLIIVVFPIGIFGGVIADYSRSILAGADKAYWPVLLAMTGALVAGTVLLIVASLMASTIANVITFGCTKASVIAGNGNLKIHQKGALFSRKAGFALTDIDDIGMSPTGNRTNEFRECELRLRLKDESEHTFLKGRDAKELQWIATKITDQILA